MRQAGRQAGGKMQYANAGLTLNSAILHSRGREFSVIKTEEFDIKKLDLFILRLTHPLQGRRAAFCASGLRLDAPFAVARGSR